MRINEFGQHIGETVEPVDFHYPDFKALSGSFVTIEHICVEQHLDDIWQFYRADHAHPKDWTYLFQEPFATKSDVQKLLEDYEVSTDPYFLAVRDNQTNTVLATFSLARIDTKNRVCEMSRVIYAPEFRRTRAATEAQYLMMRYVFETMHCRRYEWKCDSLNIASRRAAERLGFTFEGRFRNAVIYKGRSRDTDWLSVIDSEWPILKNAFTHWLSDSNFNENGQQIQRLEDFRYETIS